ncbi:hypothetical protein ACFQ4G_20075 [Methylobacterium marchantiae]|uniref:DUF2568 domain-containing protein n=2 Tax=Methylobacterium marchantiae TaxID=600331 RepID=A0ABW3X391_9HYPH
MADLFASGRIIDLILALVALETLGLVAWHVHTGRGAALRPLLCTLVSGAALMLAVRTALTGAPWIATACCLAVSLLAHLGDLFIRLREPIRRNPDVSIPGTSSESVAFPGHSYSQYNSTL